MYLRDVMSALLRRWYLTLVAVVLAVASVAFVISEVGPTFQTKGSVFLVPPVDPENPHANRLLGLGGLGQARDVLVRALDSDTLHADLTRRYPGTEYEVTADFTTSAPVVLFTVEATTPESATALRQELVNRVAPTLESIQDELNIRPASRLVAVTINAGDEPQTLQKQRIRIVLAVLAGVVAVSLTFLILVDRLLLRRRRRRSEKAVIATPVESVRPDPGVTAPPPAVEPPESEAADDTGRRPEIDSNAAEEDEEAGGSAASENDHPVRREPVTSDPSPLPIGTEHETHDGTGDLEPDPSLRGSTEDPVSARLATREGIRSHHRTLSVPAKLKGRSGRR